MTQIAIEPFVEYPQDAEIGKSYLMLVDARLIISEQNEWPYEQEEHIIHCRINPSELFSIEPVGTPVLVIHRFGETYGPARFILTPRGPPSIGDLRISLLNESGIPFGVIDLADIRIVESIESKCSDDKIGQRQSIAIDKFSDTQYNFDENVLLTTLLAASVETSLGLLAQAGLGDDLNQLAAKWHNTDARTRRKALDDALDRAYQSLRDPADAETLRSFANHHSIRDLIATSLLDPNHQLDMQSISDEMIDKFPFEPSLMRRFFRNLEVALLDDEIWGPALERLHQYRDRQEEQDALAAKELDLSASELVEQLDAHLTTLEEASVGSDLAVTDDVLSQHVQGFIDQLVHAHGERSNAIGGNVYQGIITSGDNNSITQIINVYADNDTDINDVQLREQIVDYLKWVRARYGTIKLRGVRREGQQVVQLDLETVYVPLSAQAVVSRQDRVDRHRGDLESELFADQISSDMQIDSGFRPVNLSEILDVGSRLIVTGAPGSGKTIVLQHIAWTLATAIGLDRPELAEEVLGLKHSEQDTAENESEAQGFVLPLPIFLPLSAYAQMRRESKGTNDAQKRQFADFISAYLIERQSGLDLPNDFFVRLLKSGNGVMLLLDGLDEVPDEHERTIVRQAIEDLVISRDQMMIAVTCRTAAHKGRSVLRQGFGEVQVQPLSAEHVSALVTQAYNAVYPNDVQTRKNKTDELLAGIKNLEEERHRRIGNDASTLVDSPLMVRMLLMVHLSQRRLPEHRAELYMRLTDTMLWPEHTLDEEAAERIGRLVGGDLESHRELVQHLAFAMHDRGSTQGRDIDEDSIRAILNEVAEFKPLTDDFLSLTRLRGTLLEERMGSYRFIHLAFQEYLTARYLAEVVRGEGGIEAMARFFEEGRVLDSWWREVALLVVGYLSLTTPQTARLFVRRLASIDKGANARSLLPDTAVNAAEIAATACYEWLSREQTLVADVTQRLQLLFEKETLFAQATPRVRAKAGSTLSLLGDPRDLDKMIPIRGDTFTMGTSDAEEEEAVRSQMSVESFTRGEDTVRSWIKNEKPQHAVKLADFSIAKYPVTNGQYEAFVNATDHKPPEHWQGKTAPLELRNHPVVNVSWRDAVAYCAWLTETKGAANDKLYRLPSEAEWEMAARGTDKRLYPWGNEFEPTKCNAGETDINGTSTVGLFPQGTSPFGCADMAGNVDEWCSTERRDYPYKADDGRESMSGEGSCVLRGGAFDDYRGCVRCAFRYSFGPDSMDLSFGFRCASPGC